MVSREQNRAWERFLDEPPGLEGGAGLSARALDERRALLRFEHEGSSLELRAGWLAVPYPSGLRRLIAADPALQAVVVERVPRGLDAAAREMGISYLDRRGRGRVVGPGFVYVASPLPVSPADSGARDLPGSAGELPGSAQNPRASKPRVSPFAPKASRIVRALLARPEEDWRLSSLASEVDVDPGNAHRVLGALVDSGIVERDDDRYFVPDPGSLLEAWAERARRPKDRIQIRVAGIAEAVRDLVEMAGGEVVVSGELAAEMLAAHLPSKSALVHCLSSDAWNSLERRAEEWPQSPGSSGRIQIDLADEGVGQFGSEVGGLRLPAPAQIYVDLARDRGRGREAAEHLRREVLGY